MIIAEVCANVQTKSISQTFTYIVPDKLNFLTAGWRVVVPFGNRKKIDGFVMSVRKIPDDTKFPFALKEIADAFDEEAWFSAAMLRAAQWLADFYLCPLAQSMSLFMPTKHVRKIKLKLEKVFKLVGTFDEENFTRKVAQLKALKILQEKNFMTAAQFHEEKISDAVIKKLLDTNLIEVEMRRVLRDSYAQIKPVQKNFELTAEQIAAVDALKKSIDAKKFSGFLLHGVTGSGKTQVYVEAAKIARQLGRKVVV
ncbi:MAG: DEAD/DEAH box helicase family protein, partial [Selenomonadaceae bacterium]|nr:DEAD/DEAH box helicase family protein [Selenomonadaceae bacterium]